MDVFDSETSADVRMAAVREVQQASRHEECAYESYLLGLLHRYGPELPGNPLPRDPVQATRLLETYALDGNVLTFAELAELALAESDARAAMQWTQVYLHLLHEQKSLTEDFDRRGYNADLLKRATLAMRKDRSQSGRTSAKTLLNDYLAKRNEWLIARSAQSNAAPADEEASNSRESENTLEVSRRPDPVTLNDLNLKPGYAVFLMEVQPDGTVSRIVAESFAPSIDHAVKLRRSVEGFQFHPFQGDEPEIARVPAMYGNPKWGAATLKAK